MARGQAVLAFLTEQHEINKPVDIMILTETWVKQANHLHYWLNSNPIGKHYHVISCHEGNQNKNAVGQGVAIIILKIWVPFIRYIKTIPGRLILLTLNRLSEAINIGAIYYPSGTDTKQNQVIAHQIEHSIHEHIKKKTITKAAEPSC